MSLFQKEESYLGVDIGAGGIKIVELKKTKGRPQLWTYGILNKSLDIHIGASPQPASATLGVEDSASPSGPLHMNDPRIDEYAGYLKKLLKDAKITSKHVVASIPVSYIFHTIVTLPEIEKNIDKEEIIFAEVNKLMARDVNDMQVVHQEIPQSEEEKQKAQRKRMVCFDAAFISHGDTEEKCSKNRTFRSGRCRVSPGRSNAQRGGEHASSTSGPPSNSM